MSTNHTEIDVQEMLHRLERCEHRQKAIGGLLLAVVVGCTFFSMRTPAISQTSSQLQAEITALQNTLKFVTTTGTDMVISGANVHIVNGWNETSNVNGLGNLIIGYNEKRNDNPSTDVRFGSHNLVIGEQNSFSSYGGMVGGKHNTITAAYASVDGGLNNSASGLYTNVVGGYSNTASGTYSSVSGGQSNAASGTASSVTGGYSNTAAATASSITGGQTNTANGSYSIVLGGLSNTSTQTNGINPLLDDIATINTSITGINTSITGINKSINTINTTLASDSTAITALQTSSKTYNTEITQLQTNTQYITTGTDMNGHPAIFIKKCNVWVQSGSGHTDDGGTLTGLGNLIIGYNELSGASNGNPNGNIRTGSHNLVVGTGNSYNSYAGVVFGSYNSSLAGFCSVTGGGYNTAKSNSDSVSGGGYNTASGGYSSISGGALNQATGFCSSVSGGQQNTSGGDETSILGGGNENISAYVGHYP